MNPLATIRQGQIPWARRVLGLFVVVWLNMALQPCAMAFGDMNGHDCLHCPPADSRDASSHDGHESHDSDLSATPCETSASECAFLDDYKYDGRTVKVKVKDAPSDSPLGIAPASVAIPVADSVPVALGIGDVSYRPGNQPPLNVLHCVYLK